MRGGRGNAASRQCRIWRRASLQRPSGSRAASAHVAMVSSRKDKGSNAMGSALDRARDRHRFRERKQPVAQAVGSMLHAKKLRPEERAGRRAHLRAMGEPGRYTRCCGRAEGTHRRIVARGRPTDAGAARSCARRTAVFERETGTGARAQRLARPIRACRIARLSGSSRRGARRTGGPFAARQSAGQHRPDHLGATSGRHCAPVAIEAASGRGARSRRRDQRAGYRPRPEAAAHPGRRRAGRGLCAVGQPQAGTRGAGGRRLVHDERDRPTFLPYLRLRC